MSDSFELGPNQKAWIAALRSGEYKQGRRMLVEDDKYCCLGVGCVMIGGNPVDRNMLYDSEAERLGLFDRAGSRSGETRETRDCLWFLNDVVEMTFEGIADLLEFSPASYFRESR